VGDAKAVAGQLICGVTATRTSHGGIALTAQSVHDQGRPGAGEQQVRDLAYVTPGWHRLALRIGSNRAVQFRLDGEPFFESEHGITLRADGSAALVVAGRNAAIDNVEVIVRESAWPGYGSELSFTAVTANGRSLEPTAPPVVEAEPGQMLAGMLELQLVRQGSPQALFPAAATVSWDRQERRVLERHVPPGIAPLRYDFHVSAPKAPGTYWIVVLAGTVYDADELLGCDHRLEHGGPPEGPYDNGNDVWDWGPRQFMAAFNGLPVHGTMNGRESPILARAVKVIVTAKGEVAR
jgi:hypothetical protein